MRLPSRNCVACVHKADTWPSETAVSLRLSPDTFTDFICIFLNWKSFSHLWVAFRTPCTIVFWHFARWSRRNLSSRCRPVPLGYLYGNCIRQQRENNPVSRCLHVKYCYKALCAPAAQVENTLTAIRSATGPPVWRHTEPPLDFLC